MSNRLVLSLDICLTARSQTKNTVRNNSESDRVVRANDLQAGN